MMNKQTSVVARVTLSVLVAVLIMAGSRSVMAQTTTPTASQTDEQVLRDLIRQQNEGKDVIKFTDDAIFVSGAFPRPIIGKQQAQAAEPKWKEMAKSRPNQSKKNEVVRLVVSQSGDMAEEFGNFTVSYDKPDKTRTSFNGSYLRVWRKMGGEWQVDAFFARPNQP